MTDTALALAEISHYVNSSYPPSVYSNDELTLRRRVGKVNVEAGELADAMEGYTGENPRKGFYATKQDVMKELLDTAAAALAAYEHMNGNNATCMLALNNHVMSNAARLGLIV